MIMEAASLSRKTMGAATSSTVAHRPRGICSRNGPPISGRPQYEVGHVGHHHRRVDAVDADVVLAEFQGGNPGDVVQCGFGRPVGDVAVSATMLAWLETLTIAPPLPWRIMEGTAYLMTSRAPRALMLMTLSKTSMSVSCGVAISPPKPPQFTTPQRSRPSMASRMLSSEVRSKAKAARRFHRRALPASSSLRALAITFAPRR